MEYLFYFILFYFLNRLNDINYLNDIGIVLSIEEKAGLELCFSRLKVNEKINELYFWGKIMGKEGDYFICYYLTINEVPKVPCKKFYYWYKNLLLLLLVQQIIMN